MTWAQQLIHTFAQTHLTPTTGATAVRRAAVLQICRQHMN